jgi:hypothetical protein
LSTLKIAILLALKDHGPMADVALWNALQEHSWISVAIAITELEIDGLVESVSVRWSPALLQLTSQGRRVIAGPAQTTQEVPIGSF